MQAWRAQYEAQRQYNSLSALPGLQVSTLVLAGDQDRLAQPEDAQLLTSLIPNSRHLINYEQADLFHQHLLHFLGQPDLMKSAV